MTAADLKTLKLALGHARFRGKQKLPDDNDVVARRLLSQLGVMRTVADADELAALGEGAVVRDEENFICEKFGEGQSALWYATRSTRPREPALPAAVLDAGDEP